MNIRVEKSEHKVKNYGLKTGDLVGLEFEAEEEIDARLIAKSGYKYYLCDLKGGLTTTGLFDTIQDLMDCFLLNKVTVYRLFPESITNDGTIVYKTAEKVGDPICHIYCVGRSEEYVD